MYYRDEFINESLLFSHQDLCLNIDKWKPGQNNILFVTGHMGSGKSTIAKEYAKQYRATYIEIDNFFFFIDDTDKDIINRCIENCPKYKEYYDIYHSDNRKKKEIVSSEEALAGCSEAISYAINELHKDINNLYVIEGTIVFTILDIELFKNEPIVIKGSSFLRSCIQAAKRVKMRDIESLKKNKNEIDMNFFFKTFFSNKYMEKQLKEFRDKIMDK